MTTSRTARRNTAVAAVVGALSLSGILTPSGASAAREPVASNGPTTTVKPYVLPVADGVSITSLLTVGDKPTGNGYRMVGIPDGLGAYDMGNGELGLLMNHELRETAGIRRDHGYRGAFVPGRMPSTRRASVPFARG